MPVIEVEGLSKSFRVSERAPGLAGALVSLVRPRYRTHVAVDQVSFTVDKGEMVGYIGVNGAGKSTTIKMLAGILVPSSGRVRVLGRDPHRERVANARHIGVVFGQRSQLWWDLPLAESLNLIAKIYDLEPARYRRLLDRFVERLSLAELLRVPVRNMSLGQKMRAELAAALIHEPELLYLDEPTIGLDPVVKQTILEFIREQNRERGATAILTTHDLGDIEELCQRVIILSAGKVIYDGPLATIHERFGRQRTITFQTESIAGPLSLPDGAEVVERGERRLVLRFDRSRATATKVVASVMEQTAVSDFSITEPDLTSIVKQLYGGALAIEAGG